MCSCEADNEGSLDLSLDIVISTDIHTMGLELFQDSISTRPYQEISRDVFTKRPQIVNKWLIEVWKTYND